jgi:hypothetical protein
VPACAHLTHAGYYRKYHLTLGFDEDSNEGKFIKINSAASPGAAALIASGHALGDEFRPAHDRPVRVMGADMGGIALIIGQADHQARGFAYAPPQ